MCSVQPRWESGKQRRLRDEFLRPLNQGLVNIGSATKSVYKPVTLPTLAKTTRNRYLSVYKNYL